MRRLFEDYKRKLVTTGTLHHPDNYNSILKLYETLRRFFLGMSSWFLHACAYIIIVNVTLHGFRFWSKDSRYILPDY